MTIYTGGGRMAGKSWAQSLALFNKWMNSGEIIPPDNQRVYAMMWAAWQKAMTVAIASGQLGRYRKKIGPLDTLFSEDLY